MRTLRVVGEYEDAPIFTVRQITYTATGFRTSQQHHSRLMARKSVHTISAHLVVNADHEDIAMVTVLQPLLLAVTLQHDVAGGVPARKQRPVSKAKG